eukprot:TRINITY_DN3550_c0_g1_i1.p1 TRINITY_DN3550_c0_g1~~TRINITY_DN3550_c0_g1_i1.p1  ORF type:complete len:511 (+),score=21.80 TRINITY_DN3550_c0_g1_i1:2-1534(+)
MLARLFSVTGFRLATLSSFTMSGMPTLDDAPTAPSEYTPIRDDLPTQTQGSEDPASILGKIKENSRKFGGFPYPHANLVEDLEPMPQFDNETLAKNVKSVRPIVHPRVEEGIRRWIQWLRANGTEKEKKVYASLTMRDAFQRFITNRPRVFYTGYDQWLGTHDKNGSTTTAPGWETVGTDNERPPLVVENYMTYKEIKFAALVFVSSFSAFINDGNRYNQGRLAGNPSSYEKQGVIIGCVGARYERPGQMDWQDSLVDTTKTEENGYGANPKPGPAADLARIWADVYNVPHLPTLKEAQAGNDGRRFVQLRSGYLDCSVYTARIRISAEVILMEANTRAAETGQKAYVHVVGLGLGVWQVSQKQVELFGVAFAEAMDNIDLPNVADVDFSWISGLQYVGKSGNGSQWKGKRNEHIRIHISKRSPQEPLTGDNKGKLLFVTYAWDGNALPGNEYWLGASYLSASGDPAAACCSQVPELHNPWINTELTGAKTHVADPSTGKVVPLPAEKLQ